MGDVGRKGSVSLGVRAGETANACIRTEVRDNSDAQEDRRLCVSSLREPVFTARSSQQTTTTWGLGDIRET